MHKRNFYRSTGLVFLFLVVAAVASWAQTFTTVVSFNQQSGILPTPLVQGSDGNLYGTTLIGGSHNQGTIFKLNPTTGALTTLYNFNATTDGSHANAMIQATDGNFYGTTFEGGANQTGTIFKITPSGTFTTLYSFGLPNSADAGYSTAGLVQASDGNFYGTTTLGGNANLGNIFQMTPGGAVTTLYSFGTSASAGAKPGAGMVPGTDGNLYGTTTVGGTNGDGTIFKSTLAGAVTTLYNFSGTDGSGPYGLIQASDGNFYGTTNTGGTKGDGTVFRITPSGALIVLHSFAGIDGNRPHAGLVQATDGNFYGTTNSGGTGSGAVGTVFQVTQGCALNTLYSFSGGNDGSLPITPLVQAANGALYGTTSAGGASQGGTIFSVTLPTTAPSTPATTATPSINCGGVVPVYSSSPVIQPGEWVSIYGSNLAAAAATWTGNFPTSLGNTSVTINGKSAYLWFVSPGQINLQAPDDMTIGTVPVVVTTASGSFTSSVTLSQFAPSFSLLDSKHVTGIIPRSDGSGAYGGGTYDIVGPTGSSLGYPTVAARAGDIVELFAVGFGPTNPVEAAGKAFSAAAPATNSVTTLINNVPVMPSFAGLIEAGLFQINVTIPAGLGTGDVPLQGTVGGIQTPSGVVISLR